MISSTRQTSKKRRNTEQKINRNLQRKRGRESGVKRERREGGRVKAKMAITSKRFAGLRLIPVDFKSHFSLLTYKS